MYGKLVDLHNNYLKNHRVLLMMVCVD